MKKLREMEIPPAIRHDVCSLLGLEGLDAPYCAKVINSDAEKFGVGAAVSDRTILVRLKQRGSALQCVRGESPN
jgi:hypothetical protein